MIADQIKRLREGHGLAQKDLAKLVGVTRSSVNAWEMGTNVPTTQYVLDLARIFRVSTDCILDISPQITLTLDGLSDEQKDIVFRLVKYFDSINEEKE